MSGFFIRGAPMRKFALLASLLCAVCLSGTAAYSQGAVTLAKTVSKNGKAMFNIVVGGVVIGTCYATECANAVLALKDSQLPSAEDLKAPPKLDEEEVENPKEKKKH
jgi:hypothetical protein